LKNPLTINIESSLGAIYLSMLSMFFIGLIFIAVKNFETDMDVDMIMNISNSISTRKMSQTELVLLREWIKNSEVEIPEGQGYKYLMREYPNRPWLQ